MARKKIVTRTAGENAEELDCSYISEGNIMQLNNSGKQVVTYKTKHATTIQASNCILGHLS